MVSRGFPSGAFLNRRQKGYPQNTPTYLLPEVCSDALAGPLLGDPLGARLGDSGWDWWLRTELVGLAWARCRLSTELCEKLNRNAPRTQGSPFLGGVKSVLKDPTDRGQFSRVTFWVSKGGQKESQKDNHFFFFFLGGGFQPQERRAAPMLRLDSCAPVGGLLDFQHFGSQLRQLLEDKAQPERVPEGINSKGAQEVQDKPKVGPFFRLSSWSL